ncbi:MAG: metal ABC transporter permease [Desulfurococcales archaeon]|nr:metal ABC transporter permease [Desulfurococcales archaeon]
MKSFDYMAAGLLAASLMAGLYVGVVYDIYWPLNLAAAGLAFGSLSLLVYSRRLMYIAAASPHGAFLSASLAIPTSIAVGGPVEAWTLVFSMLTVYIAWYLVGKGLDPDEATSIYVGVSATGGVLAAYLVLTRYPYSPQVIASIIGDPLLASRGEVLLALAIALVFLLASASSLREILYVGADPEDARLSGMRVWVYDLFLYTSIAVIAAVMVRVVGFVLEHVMILLPGLIAHYTVRGAYRAFTASIVASLSASILGLYLAILLDQSPSAMTGLILITAFLIAVARGRS